MSKGELRKCLSEGGNLRSTKRLFYQQSKSLSGKKAYITLYRLIAKDKHLDDNKALKALEIFEEMGIGLELSYFSLPWNLEADSFKSELNRHKDLLKDFKQDTSMHGAFYGLNPTARDPLLLEVARFRVQQSLDIADELGMDKIVFHANYFHSNKSGYKELWMDKQAEFWGQFIPTIEARNQRIFIENTREENPSCISGVLSRLDHDRIKTCYDTGHSSCFTESKLHVNEWVKGYGTQLGYIHLHSNDALNDLHIAFHKGKQDFTGFFEAVQAIDPLPLLIVEVKSRESFQESMAELKRIGIYKKGVSA